MKKADNMKERMDTINKKMEMLGKKNKRKW